MDVLGRSSRRRSVNIWPGFVDALATLLLVVIFVLMVFMVAQFFLSTALTGRDQALSRLERQVNDLAALLSLERDANAELRINVAQLSSELQASLIAREDSDAQLAALNEEREDLIDVGKSLQERLAALTREQETVLGGRESLRKQLAALAKERTTLAEDQESLTSLLATTEKERDSLTLDVQSLTSERDSLEGQIAALIQARDALAEEKSGLEEALAATSEDRDELQALKDSLDERLAAIAAEHAALQTNEQSLRNQVATLTQDNAKIVERLAALDAENTKVNAELADAYKTIEVDKETIQTQLAEIAAMESLRKELEASYQTIEADKETIETQLAELAALAKVRAELQAAYQTIEADKEKIEAQLTELAVMQRLQQEVAEAEKTIQVDKETIEAQVEELALLKGLRDEMLAQLDAAEAALAAQRGETGQLQEKLGEQAAISEEAKRQVQLLNRQLASLRQQLANLNTALEAAEAENLAQDVQIADLGKKLNVALASKVQELARYRSEFFGRLRQVLGKQQGIREVGDRFVFQSEVLFDSGSAQLGEQGKVQLSELAQSLRELEETIPTDIDWVLRVDGHTDRNPISTSEFPSNWELSTARAVSVVKYLIARGTPSHRLAATGFGEFQPLEEGTDEIAFRRNRRIELKLTQR